MTTDTPEPSDLLAAEFVLGCLDARRLRQAHARLQRDADFARLVERWSVRLSPLNEAHAPEVPDDSLWQGIEERLPQPRGHATARPKTSGIPLARLFGWGAAALAAAFALMLLIPGDLSRPTGGLVATLETESRTTSWIFAFERRKGTFAVRQQGAPLQITGQSLELWLVSADGGVESLGLLPQGGTAHMRLPPAAIDRMVPGTTLAISREPLGGSPGGQPSGPVIASALLASN